MDDSTFTSFKMPSRERVDIRVGIERRRRWSREEKLRIVRESLEPNAMISEVARRNEISASLIYAWRRQALAGLIEGFHAVRIVAEPEHALTAIETDDLRETASTGGEAKPDVHEPPRSTGLIEVGLPGGVEVRVPADVEPRALRLVLNALGARADLVGTSVPHVTGPARGRRR